MQFCPLGERDGSRGPDSALGIVQHNCLAACGVGIVCHKDDFTEPILVHIRNGQILIGSAVQRFVPSLKKCTDRHAVQGGIRKAPANHNADRPGFIQYGEVNGVDMIAFARDSREQRRPAVVIGINLYTGILLAALCFQNAGNGFGGAVASQID